MLRLSDEELARFRRALFKQALQEILANARQRPPKPRGRGLLVEDDHGRPVLLEFDEQGFVAVFRGHDEVWRLDNDAQGRPVALQFPDGLRYRLRHDEGGRLLELGPAGGPSIGLRYDAGGHLEALSFPDHTVLGLPRDRHGRLQARVDRGGGEERYRYDTEGNLLEIVEPGDHRWRFDYQGWDRPTRISYPDARREILDYDARGRLQRLALAADHRESPRELVCLDYHGAGDSRPGALRYADGERLDLQFDGRLRLREARLTGSRQDGLLRFVYDSAGRVAREQQDGFQVDYHYAQGFCCAGFTTQQGPRASFGHDRALRPETLSDALGKNYRWRYDGQTLALRFPNGLEDRQRRGQGGHLLERSLHAADGSLLQRAQYRYDADGRLRALRDAHGTREYRYDRLQRLLSVHHHDTEQRYRYDPAGRRLRQDGVARRHDQGGRLIAHGDAVTLDYDTRGNVSALRRGDRHWRFHYSDRNLLVLAESAQMHLEFAYDALGRRTLKRCHFTDGHPGHAIHYRWAGEQLLREEYHAGDHTGCRDYYYVPGGGRLLAMVIDGRWYGCHVDHRGAVVALSSSAGELVWQGRYNVLGACESEGEVFQPHRLPGYYHDPETGLYYDRFRYYEPELGWYLSPDPFGLLRGLCPYRDRGDGHLDPRVRHWPVTAEVAARVSPRAALVLTAPSPLLSAPPPAPLPLLQRFLAENLNVWLEHQRLRGENHNAGRQALLGEPVFPRLPYADQAQIHRALAEMAGAPGQYWHPLIAL